MSYSHKTVHSFTPNIEFWRSIEILFLKFPFCEQGSEFDPRDDIINYYEEKYRERFDVTDNDNDIYGEKLKIEFLFYTTFF